MNWRSSRIGRKVRIDMIYADQFVDASGGKSEIGVIQDDEGAVYILARNSNTVKEIGSTVEANMDVDQHHNVAIRFTEEKSLDVLQTIVDKAREYLKGENKE